MIVMFFYFRYKISKQISGEEAGNAIREELENLVRDINRITMRNSTIIETKITELREAVKEGEKCIVSLGKMTREKEDNDNLYKEMKIASIKQRAQKRVEKDAALHQELPLDFSGSKKESNFELNNKRVKEVEITEKEPLVSSQGVNINQEIIDLHKKGLSLGDIAKRIAKPKGEVEMIIELYSNK